MDAKPQRQKRRENALSLLNVAIEAMDLAKEVSSATPAKAVFGSVSVLLTMIKDSMANRADYVELGLACADVCKALQRGLGEKKLEDLSQSVREAIEQLKRTVEEIRGNITEKGGRNLLSRLVHAKDDKEMLAAWGSDLNRVLHVFNTELAINTHVMVLDIHRNVVTNQEGTEGQHRSTQPSISPGELPPPRPRACFGREDLIEKITALAEHLSPIALIGPGGIGKTSIALTVLHHDRIRKRFGENRRFIRCDQFPASRTHLLSRLSKVVGAGIENPEDLTPLRPFLSSREMILFLDNAESILDPRGTNAQEIYSVVEELSQLENICLCLTSRISTTPPDCKHLDIPTLTMDAACNAFYRVYDSDEQSGLVNNILKQLDFHPLSITLLATVAHHNKWDTDRLSKEWERRRTAMLHTQYNTSLATTIELSLASPMFQELGPDARELLGVAAFFPQGINESNLDWLFPTLSDQTNIFDNFCILSLTYRSNGFVTMLAPLRDYLRPKDPTSSPFLHATKDRYFSRLSTPVSPGKPDFHAARWIGSEDLNVEHLLDVYTSIDPSTADVWDACAHFMQHLYWHKKRLVMLGPKVEGLPDDHPYKPECLFQLSRLFHSVGNYVEYKRLLVQTLGLWRKWGDDLMVAETLGFISNANRWLDLREEGIDQAKETLEIYKRVGHVSGQAVSLHQLGWLLYEDKHPDAAEKAASQAIELLSGGNQFEACECRRLLGLIHRSRGETEKAIEHFETAIGIASPSGWLDPLFWSNYSLAELFFGEGRFDDAHVHIERAKSHATGDRHWLARAMELQAGFWYEECKFEEARTEALGAVDLYESLGATKYLEYCKTILRNSEEKMKTPVASGGNNLNA